MRSRAVRRNLKHARMDCFASRRIRAKWRGCWAATVKDVQARRMEIALKAAADWNAIVILKGTEP